MANRIDLQVGVVDDTKAGNDQVIAGAAVVQKTLNQRHQEMLETQRQRELEYAQKNADALLNADHVEHAQRLAEYAEFRARLQKEADKWLEKQTQPLTQKQLEAADAARALLASQQPAPIVQRVVADAAPIAQPTVAHVVQRVAVDQAPIATPTPAPVSQAVEIDAAGQEVAMKEALRLNAQLTKSVQELAAAERVLHQDPATQFSESELARLRFVESQLRDSQFQAFELAKAFRELGDSVPDGGQFHAMADAIERDAVDSGHALDSLSAKIEEVNQHHATIAVKAEGVEKTLAEFRNVSEAATEAAMKARSYFEQGNQASQTAQDLQRFADVIKKSGDNSAVAQAQLASLLAQAAQADQEAGKFYALAKSEEEVARVALRAANGFSNLSKEEGAAGQAAQKLIAHNKQLAASLDATAFAQQRVELQRASQQYEAAGQASSRGAQGMLQLAYAADDVQYGMRGIVNNIPGLLTALGVSGGLAGAVAIAAVGITVLTSHWKEFEQAIANPGAALNSFKAWSKGMIAEVNNFRAAVNEAGVGLWQSALDSVGLLSDEQKKAHTDELLRIGQERVALDRTNQIKANQALVAKAAEEQRQEAAKRAREFEVEKLDTIEKANAAYEAQKKKVDEIAAGPKKGFLPVDTESAKNNLDKLASIAAQRDRLLQADEKRRIASAESAAKAQTLATSQLVAHNEELSRQREIEKEINDIKSRAQQAKDDPNEAAKRKALEFARERGLDAIKEQTEAAKRAADLATAADYLSASQKKAARAAYTQAVLSQIAVEAESNQQAHRQLAEQMQADAEKQAAFDEEIIAARERQARDAQARLTQEIEANAAAQQLAGQLHAAEREAAAARLAKAEADAIKANDAAQKARDDSEDARQQRQRTIENTSATKRLNDEQAIGAAKQKALLDADQLERRLAAQKEADRNAKLQQALQADPRIAAKGEDLARNVKPQDLEKAARRKAVDQAEQAVRDQNEQDNAKRRERGEEEQKVNPRDVQQARKGAAQEFNRKLKRGDAEAELADERERIAKRLVEQAEQRGQLDGPQANALRALAEKNAEDARMKAGVENRAEGPDNDPAARAEQAKQRAEKQKQENADKVAKRKAEEEAKQQKAREFADANQKAARVRKHQREQELAREAERQRQREADNQPDPMPVPPNPLDLFGDVPLPPVPPQEPIPEAAPAEPTLEPQKPVEQPEPPKPTLDPATVAARKAKRDSIIDKALQTATDNNVKNVTKLGLEQSADQFGDDLQGFADHVADFFRRHADQRREEAKGVQELGKNTVGMVDPSADRLTKAAQDISEQASRLTDDEQKLQQLQKDVANLFQKDQKQPQREKPQPAFADEPVTPVLQGAGGADVIVAPVEIDDADARRELSDLTQPRDVVITARVEREDITAQNVTDVVAVDQQQRADLVGQSVTDNVSVVQQDRRTTKPQNVTDTITVDQQARKPLTGQQITDRILTERIDANPQQQQPQVPPAPQPQNSQSAASLKAVAQAMQQLGAAQQKNDSAVLDAINQLTALVTEQAKRQVQTTDVVAQVVSHVNQLASQFTANDNAARLRAMSAGGV